LTTGGLFIKKKKVKWGNFHLRVGYCYECATYAASVGNGTQFE